jgi:hypothetical protein
VATLGDHTEECLATAGRAAQAVEAAVLTGAALGVDETLDVLALLDLLAAVPASNGSTMDGRGATTFGSTPACPSTRCTVVWCSPSWSAMVPMGHFSPW